jgi:hypothetical protein
MDVSWGLGDLNRGNSYPTKFVIGRKNLILIYIPIGVFGAHVFTWLGEKASLKAHPKF